MTDTSKMTAAEYAAYQAGARDMAERLKQGIFGNAPGAPLKTLAQHLAEKAEEASA